MLIASLLDRVSGKEVFYEEERNMETRNIKSLLFVPAEEQKLKKIKAFYSDAFILDLEDSIKESNKKNALKATKNFLETFECAENPIFVRINADNIEAEISELKDTGIEGVVLPKAESACKIEEIKESIGDKKIIPLIETPMGMVNLSAIAKQPSVWAIAFGAEDYCCEAGTKNEEHYLLPIKTEIVKYAHAYRKKCFDTIALEFKEKDKIYQSSLHSYNLGFDGKLAIHPSQVEQIHRAFNPKNEFYMKKVLEAFEKCENGVLKFEGKIYEKPHIEKIKRDLKNQK